MVVEHHNHLIVFTSLKFTAAMTAIHMTAMTAMTARTARTANGQLQTIIDDYRKLDDK